MSLVLNTSFKELKKNQDGETAFVFATLTLDHQFHKTASEGNGNSTPATPDTIHK